MPNSTYKHAIDDFMLKEYESIASAHFDSQSGLRQQFRFYLLIAAVPATVLGLAFRDRPAPELEHLGMFDLPRILAWIFFAVGILGALMLLSMINTALDASLYARTVNGIRHYFVDRARATDNDITKYLKMPIDQRRPSYFHVRAFFWQVLFISMINSFYVVVAVQSLTGDSSLSIGIGILSVGLQIFMYWRFARQREKHEISSASA